MSETPRKSTPSKPLYGRDWSNKSAIQITWTERDGAKRRLLLAGSRRDVAVTVGLLSLSRHVDHRTVQVSPMDVWDDDEFAGEFVRAALAYLAADPGRVRAKPASRVPGRTDRKGS